MNFVSSAVANSAIAMRMIMDFLSTPTLAGVLIYQETGKITRETEISEQVMIDNSGGRLVVHDNFMIKPKKWEIKGYLKPMPYEVSFAFQPSLKRQKIKLEEAMETRDTVPFKDKEGKYYDVGIEICEIDEIADCQNAIPIRVVLKQTTKLSVQVAVVDKIESQATPSTGDVNGESLNTGTNLFKNMGGSNDASIIYNGVSQVGLVGG